MPLNGSGTYVAPASSWNPAVDNTDIDASDWIALLADMSTALSTAMYKDGQATPTANLPMAGFKLTGVGAATARTDAASLANIQDGTGVYSATVGGTADVITLTPSPAITAYAAGQTFRFIASGANTTNVTVNISGLGAKAITKNGTTALVAGDIPSGTMVEISYDGTRFILGTSVGGIPATIFDAAGDLIQASAADAAARLAIGTAGQLLRVNAGATAVEWGADLAASDTVVGNIEIAIQSEMETGSSTTLAVTPGRQQFHPSAAKGWAKFDYAGAAQASYNVTSITDDGTGLATVTWATDFSSANYAAVGTALTGDDLVVKVLAQAAGTTQYESFASNTGTAADGTNMYAVAFGDQ